MPARATEEEPLEAGVAVALSPVREDLCTHTWQQQHYRIADVRMAQAEWAVPWEEDAVPEAEAEVDKDRHQMW